MRIAELISRLPANHVTAASLADDDAEVYTVAFLTNETSIVRDDVLYFGDTTLLPRNVPKSCTLNCVLYGHDNESELSGNTQSNLICLAPDVDPFACYNILQDLFLESQDQVNIVRRMLMAHFSNKGLQYLIEEAACALGNPILVVDTTYRYIAYHLSDLEGSDSSLEKVITGEIKNETLLEEAIEYIHSEGIDRALALGSGPLVRKNSLLDANTMTAAVMANGVCMAHVMMVEHNHPFCDVDLTCFARLADFVGQEMQKSEVWSPTVGELGAHFLTNLIGDSSPSEAVTLRRLKALDFHPKKYLQVLCLHAKGEGLGQLEAEKIAGQLRPILHHSLYTRYHQQLVALVSRDDTDGVGAYGEQLLEEIATLNGLSCGMSNTFTRVVHTRSAYQQARRAVRFGERLGTAIDDGCLFRYSDYAFMHTLELADRRTNLLSLCHPALKVLRDYDERHNGDLMDTLYCYLQVAGSTTRAAQMLTLHKNTLLYRLNRIREILGINLASGEDLFQLQTGFRIMLYLGLFKPRIVMRRDQLRG